MNTADEGRASSYFVENGSYLKLRTLQVGYTIPSSILSKLKMTSARVYLSGQNLLTIKSNSLTCSDPENPNWNSWFDAMLYNRMSSNLTTLQYELMKLLSSVTNQGTSAEAMKNAAGTVTPTSVRAAATIITMLPIICIYPFLQKYFVAGLTLGGVKE